MRKTIARREKAVGGVSSEGRELHRTLWSFSSALWQESGLAAVEVATMAAGTIEGGGVVAHYTVRQR